VRRPAELGHVNVATGKVAHAGIGRLVKHQNAAAVGDDAASGCHLDAARLRFDADRMRLGHGVTFGKWSVSSRHAQKIIEADIAGGHHTTAGVLQAWLFVRLVQHHAVQRISVPSKQGEDK
jgi:hypothetical protein